MIDCSYRLFVGFAAEDRYTIAQPIVHHLKNYGVNVWYDRQALLLGDDRRKRNLEEGAGASTYACIVISKYTEASPCAMEEFSIVRERFLCRNVTVFPILYELSADDLPNDLQWVKGLIFKEVNRCSGTREICNHIACKISEDLLSSRPYKCIIDVIAATSVHMPIINAILISYQKIDCANLNAKISLLYAAYLTIAHSVALSNSSEIVLAQRIFERLFSETQLNLSVDYRDLWLLEDALCILINHCLASKTESSI